MKKRSWISTEAICVVLALLLIVILIASGQIWSRCPTPSPHSVDGLFAPCALALEENIWDTRQ